MSTHKLIMWTGTDVPDNTLWNGHVGLSDEDGEVVLFALGRDGQRVAGGYLCRLTATGLKHISGINPALGFPLDEKGRLKVL